MGAQPPPVHGVNERSEQGFNSATSATRPAPGRYDLGAKVAAFDRSVDGVIERMRGHRVPDTVFVTASRLGDWSLIWHLVGLARAVVEGRRGLRRSLVFAGLLGAESLIVNQGLKRLFHRPRPTREGDERFDIRRPLTSSFPSGHASAAGFAATSFIGWDGPRLAPLWATLAGAVATSRPYVRIHHASDVIAGVVVGATMGLCARQVFKRLGLG